ncbi:PmoA family protein [Dictyobacter kobayashii]|uniref:Oxidoreductase n=1 Tax=Dictyobacter kobayashii TaxID=2014872 RepID=A0A402ARX7_9CHLR|nr:PmoA family protein [Dictyobacter kobayashii]GCE21858.1 hypothetical protein KDK_56580 [Dictyobacter kobayashii]
MISEEGRDALKTTLIHTLYDTVALHYEGQPLFSYVYEPKFPARESPRPYFHSLKTLAGNEVCLVRPYDHQWHIGLSMTSANLAGENFWGGPTYTPDAGYVQLDNNGWMRHRAWQELSSEERVSCIEQLQWITHSEAVWIEEERHLDVNEINAEAGYWSLDFSSRLLNVSGKPLAFGSPTTEGRENAGYGGLFWRGPRSFLHGKILGAGGLEGPECMGKQAPWLAFTGWHDGSCEQSTIIFIDQPRNPRYPNKWFVRNDPYACISCAFMFDEYYTLQPDDVLDLSYRVVLANGEWSREQIDKYVGRLR